MNIPPAPPPTHPPLRTDQWRFCLYGWVGGWVDGGGEGGLNELLDDRGGVGGWVGGWVGLVPVILMRSARPEEDEEEEDLRKRR